MADTPFTLKIEGPENFKREFSVPIGITGIGRQAGSDIPLPHTQVSRSHARLEATGTSCSLTDLESSNGTHLNGKKMAVLSPVELKSGDRIKIGPFQIEFSRVAVEPPDTREVRPPVIDPSVVSSVEAAPEETPRPAAKKPGARKAAAKKTGPETAKPEQPARDKPASSPKKPAEKKKRAAKGPKAPPAEVKKGTSQAAGTPPAETRKGTARPAGTPPAEVKKGTARPAGTPPGPPQGGYPAGAAGPSPGGGAIPPGLSLRSRRLLNFLPGIYHSDFMARLLGIFEATLLPIEWTIDSFDLFLNPETAPEGFLPWLSSWFGITFDSTWSEEKRRTLVKEAHWIFARRGTIKALSRVLEIYTGVAPVIDDQDEKLDPFTFKVRVPLSKRSLEPKLIEALIDAHKPAHTSYRLSFRR